MSILSSAGKSLFVALLVVCWPGGTVHGDWDASLGVAMAQLPAYAGADEARVLFAPIGTLTYRDRFYVGTSTTDMGAALGVVAARSETWAWNVEYVLTEPRKERWADALTGMGDRSAGQFVSTSVQYRDGLFSASLVHGAAARAGTALMLGTGIGGEIAPRIAGMLSVKATIADRNHMNFDHGITAGQAARRSRLQPSLDAGPYNARGGLKQVDVGASLFYQPAGNWSVGATAGWRYLTGGAADSPLTQRRGNVSASIFLAFPLLRE